MVFDPFGLKLGIDFNRLGLKLVIKVFLHSGTGILIRVCFFKETTFLLIFVFGSGLK